VPNKPFNPIAREDARSGLTTGLGCRGIRVTHRGLVVFDLDGTLLRGPTVCEVIAQRLGRLQRMQEMERLSNRKQIAAAREEMARWYAEVPLSALLECLRAIQLAPGAPVGVSMLQKHGVTVGIASITWSFAVAHFAARLGVQHFLGTTLQPSGSVEHVWSEHKAAWVLDLAARWGVSREHIAAVGDSHGDCEMLKVAGKAFFVGAQASELNPEWLRWPAANIEHVAQHIIESWRLQPNDAMQATCEDTRA
jgi:HAD superfamily phosphoserine phosphatase-like hydrolase